MLHFGLYLEVAKAMRNLLKPMKENDSCNSLGHPCLQSFHFSLVYILHLLGCLTTMMNLLADNAHSIYKVGNQDSKRMIPKCQE